MDRRKMMERVQFITYKGKRILVEDFSLLAPGSEFNHAIKKAKKLIAAEPKNSVLALFDSTNSSITADMLHQINEFTKANRPFIKKCATVGVNGLLQVALAKVSSYSNREFILCDTREEALDYLASIE